MSDPEDEPKVLNVKKTCQECERNPVVKQDGKFMCARCFSEWLQIFGRFHFD